MLIQKILLYEAVITGRSVESVYVFLLIFQIIIYVWMAYFYFNPLIIHLRNEIYPRWLSPGIKCHRLSFWRGSLMWLSTVEYVALLSELGSTFQVSMESIIAPSKPSAVFQLHTRPSWYLVTTCQELPPAFSGKAYLHLNLLHIRVLLSFFQ